MVNGRNRPGAAARRLARGAAAAALAGVLAATLAVGSAEAAHESLAAGDCAAPDGRIVLGGISLPVVCGPFFRDEVTDYEAQRPGLGQSAGYVGNPAGAADVYVYDAGLSTVPEGVQARRVRAEFERAISDVFSVWKSRGAKVELLARHPPAEAIPGMEYLRADIRITHRQVVLASFVYLTGARGKFLKVRITLPEDGAAERIASEFVAGISRGL